MSAVLLIARDGHLRRNTLVNLDSAFARLITKLRFRAFGAKARNVSVAIFRNLTLIKFLVLSNELIKVEFPP